MKPPPEVTAKLAEFGVEWTGRALLIPGTNSKLELYDERNVSFSSGRSFVEIVIHNIDNTENTLLIAKGSLKYDGEELKIDFRGRKLTLGEIQDAMDSDAISHIQASGENVINKGDEKIGEMLISSLIDDYGPKGWVSRNTIFNGQLRGNQIAVSAPVRGENPIFEYQNGRYVCINYPRSYREPLNQSQFEDLIVKGPHRND